MSAPQSPLMLEADWGPLRETVARLRAGQEGVEKFIRGLLEELEAMQICLTENEQQLADSRRRLSEAHSELTRTQQHAGAMEQAAKPDPDSQRRVTELERERSELELELESVRMRAAEMSQTLAEQKRQAVEDRAQWTGELRHMRQLLERQSTSAGKAPQEAAPTPPNDTRRPAAAASRPVADPVLGSVMAQFEMLQKDVARRRATTHNGKS